MGCLGSVGYYGIRKGDIEGTPMGQYLTIEVEHAPICCMVNLLGGFGPCRGL